VVDGKDRVALVAEHAGPEFLIDPNGMRFRDSRVMLITYRDGLGEFARGDVAQVFLPPSRHAALQVVGDRVRVFLAFKATSGVFSMSGTIYEHDRATLRQVGAGPVFSDANWGWFARFDGADVIHFAYAGHRWIRNAREGDPVRPEDAEAAHIRAIIDHSDGFLQLKGKDAPDGEQRRTDERVMRLLGISGHGSN
jgi:hypothetical protein